MMYMVHQPKDSFSIQNRPIRLKRTRQSDDEDELGSAKKSKTENAPKTANKKKRDKESDDDYLHSFTKRQNTIVMTRSKDQKEAREANDDDEFCTSLAKKQKGHVKIQNFYYMRRYIQL